MSGKAEKKARIFLIDDHPMVRRGLKQLLSQEAHVICGEAGSQREALAKIGSSNADLAFLDLSLGQKSGLDLIAGLQKRGIRVLVYSMHEDVETIERAFAEGADGYVCKREMDDVIFSAVSDLLEGRRHVSPRVARSLADRFLLEPEEKAEQRLSKREKDILEMLGRGESTPAIAAALFISPRTVETYCYRIIRKLELNGMRALRQYAIRNSPP